MFNCRSVRLLLVVELLLGIGGSCFDCCFDSSSSAIEFKFAGEVVNDLGKLFC